METATAARLRPAKLAAAKNVRVPTAAKIVPAVKNAKKSARAIVKPVLLWHANAQTRKHAPAARLANAPAVKSVPRAEKSRISKTSIKSGRVILSAFLLFLT